MNYTDIANISTTGGVIISTLTLVSAFRIYWIGKRDSYIKELRNSLISYQNNSDNLNNLISYDITHEIVGTVIYSRQIERMLQKVFDKYFNEDSIKQDLAGFLEDNMDPITVSIHTELLAQYDSILLNNAQIASKIYTDYPSLYRVYEAVNLIFSQTIGISKQMIRDEEIFRDVILNAFDDKANICNVEDFKDHIFYAFMGIIQKKHSESDQKDVNDALSILSLTTNGLMRLSDKVLYKRKNEKSINYKALEKTESIFEDLLEAEKGLKMYLNESELLAFREYCTKIKVRNEK